MAEAVRTSIQRWREDPGGAYQSWFLWPERLRRAKPWAQRRAFLYKAMEVKSVTLEPALRLLLTNFRTFDFRPLTRSL